jgi:hypothetical protein
MARRILFALSVAALSVAALFVAALFVAALFVASEASAKGPIGTIKVGNWTGGAWTNDATGAFSHCAAGTPYANGIYFMVGMDVAGGWTLGFLHPAWQLQLRDSFPIDLTFDGQAQFHVFGTAAATNSVIVPMPLNSALMSQFRKSTGMTAFAKGQLFQFKLDSTSQLLPALANCVASIKANGLAHAGDFSVKPAPKTATAAAPPPAVGGSLKIDSGPPTPPELQIEAIEIASNFILKSALHSPKVLSRAETPVEIVSTGAAWRSDEATGFVRIVPPQNNVKGLDVAAAVVGNDAKDCKGKFASGRMSELVDSDVIFRGFASCEDSEGARVAQYFIVPRDKGGFVMFSVVANTKAEQAREITKDERLTDFRKAAWTAVH